MNQGGDWFLGFNNRKLNNKILEQLNQKIQKKKIENKLNTNNAKKKIDKVVEKCTTIYAGSITICNLRPLLNSLGFFFTIEFSLARILMNLPLPNSKVEHSVIYFS